MLQWHAGANETEWQFTELRSDNSVMGNTGSTNQFNRDLSDLDQFIPATTNNAIYQYWLNTYLIFVIVILYYKS